ncbi:MAG: SgcJ/EcaC family oxidoreductase [Gemmatimonadetes bacterium]|nr:SgcJ/EcaC family oxidoreductase [Gemmatimonadota bacterium]
MHDDERAIRGVIDAWHRASAAGDLAAVVEMMTDDVVFLVPGRPPFGKEAFVQAQSQLAAYLLESSSDVREVRVAGDWAYCWTNLSVTITPPHQGSAVRRAGHTLSIFRRGEDGRWLLARDANLLTAVNEDA